MFNGSPTSSRSPNETQGHRLRNLFRHVVRRAPDFKLEHLQNFPPLESHRYQAPYPKYDEFYFIDARTFSPLALLPTLTSIDLDMAYFRHGNTFVQFSNHK